jgi:putative oxidoreductase
MQMIMFMKNISIAGGFLMIVSLGGGAFSLDSRFNKNPM